MPEGGWSGALTQNARLRAGAGREAFQAWFGHSVGVSGDTVVVGAPVQNIDGNVDEGAAWIFVEPPGGWTGAPLQKAKLVSPFGASYDNVGSSVAISGDTVFVGAPGEDFLFQSDRGAAYVFVKPAGGWTGQPSIASKLVASDGSAGAAFGLHVSASSDRVLVSGGANASFYLFVKPAGGWAGQLGEIEKVPTPEGTLQFIGLSGNTMVVGSDAFNYASVFVRNYTVQYLNLRELSTKIFPRGRRSPSRSS